MSGARFLETILATDEVVDAIAEIELQRQAMGQEGGAAAAASGALRRLHVLLDGAREALQLHGESAAHLANIDAVTIEIERVKKLAPTTSPDPLSRNMRPDPRQVSVRSGARIPSRNKGRRTMGRASGR